MSRNLAIGWVFCDSRGMLQDRVVAHRTANLYAPHRYRHIVEGGGDVDEWVAEWEEPLREFAKTREEFLLYRATDAD